MKTPIVLALVTLALGCNTPAPPAPPSTAPASPMPPAGDTAQAPAPEPAPSPEQAPPSEFPPGHEPPEDDRGRGGRLAFIRCTPESRQAQGCTKEFRPVCGQVDTGIRCVQPPCPSAEPKTFSNPCMACMEPKTVGYFPRSCEELNTAAAP